MNTYLIDTNVLIRAFRSFYSMDVCPGFWEWLALLAEDGIVRSVSAVRGEIKNPTLIHWADSLPPGFFAEPSAHALSAITTIDDWVNSSRNLNRSARRVFMQSADRWLIAEALGTGATIVTFETPAPRRKNAIKIPDVCKAVGAKHTTLSRLLSREGARFVLDDTVRQQLRACLSQTAE